MKTFAAILIGCLFVYNSMVACKAGSMTDLKLAIEGVYILDEWKINGQTFRPPAVEGRFVILNGNIVTVLIDNNEELKKSYTTLYGIYSLTPDYFAYKYDTRMTFIQTPDNISVLRTLPWEGMREFTIKQRGNSVQLQFGDKAAFAFDPAGLTYSEAGKVLRVWRRAKSE
jgi:hypothetical protein